MSNNFNIASSCLALRAIESALQVAALANVLNYVPTISTKPQKFSYICSIVGSLAMLFLFGRADVLEVLPSDAIGNGALVGSCVGMKKPSIGT